MRRELVILAAALGLTACGGSGTSTTSSSSGSAAASVQGYALPTEISAVPADGASGAAGLAASLKALASAVAVADLPADSDYKQAVVKKFVEERTLEQFSIIETIFNALAQTHYAENVGQGPYKAMVAWEEKQQGRDTKTLEPWVVDSQMVQENGKDVNLVHAWVEEPDPGSPTGTHTVYAEFKIYSPATQNPDGSYADYGEWTINAAVGSTTWFAATATKDADGRSVIKINMQGQGGPSGQDSFAIKAVMNRGLDSGYGKVQYPDFACSGPNSCTASSKTAAYAYDASYLAVDDGSGTVVYKDRNAKTAFVHRYGLYYADADAAAGIAAGDDVLRHKQFGFPFRFTDSAGNTQYGYYGAWQGRHQIWAGENGSLPAGTQVTREDRGSGQPAATYYASQVFKGTLSRRTMVSAGLADIQGVPVEVLINDHFMLMWDASANGGAGAWVHCADGFLNPGDPNANPPGVPTCMDPMTGSAIGSPVPFTDFAELQPDPSGRKAVQVQGDPSGSGQTTSYLWDANAQQFMVAQQDPTTGQLSSTGTPLTPSDGLMLNVDLWGSIYVEYVGFGGASSTGWVQKELTGFDEETWTPQFGTNDQPFSPEVGREYYLNAHGANYVVRRTDPADAESSYQVSLELQQAANPKNAASFLPAGVHHLAAPWNGAVQLKLDTDPASSTFMMLVYAADDPSTSGDETGQVYTGDEWGLQAYDASGQVLLADGSFATPDSSGFAPGAVQFNWEYDEQGGWGSQQFLCRTQGCPTVDDYLTLDDPIQLQPVQLTDGAGNTRTFQLQYDGWLFGLPDPYEDLDQNGWKMTQAIADKVVNVPDGTLVTGTDGTQYYIRPLEVSLFLNEVSAPASPPDVSLGQAVDLSTVPAFDDPTQRMGATPADVTLKYSEGKPVS